MKKKNAEQGILYLQREVLIGAKSHLPDDALHLM